MSLSRGSVSSLWLGVALLDKLEDFRRGGDLRLWLLQDRIPAGRVPGGEGLAESPRSGSSLGTISPWRSSIFSRNAWRHAAGQ
jgi:hypothetical protein